MAEKIVFHSAKNNRPLHPRRCETCRHFEPPDNPNIETGSCVAQYPNVIMAGVGGGAAALTFFPQMKPTQRCAKWDALALPSDPVPGAPGPEDPPY
jgi:hypothetical protein